MKRCLKVFAAIILAVPLIILFMFGVVYVGDCFLSEIGVSVTEAKEILFMFLNAGAGIILALTFGGSLYWFVPLIWKEHKRRKKEAKENGSV